MKIGIIGAMEQEIQLLKKNMSQTVIKNIAGFNFFIGRLEGHEICLNQSGIGKVNAAIGTSLLIEQFHPDAILNTGSAGGLNPLHKIGDVVIGQEILHHDVDVTGFNYKMGQIPQLPPTFKSNKGLVDIAKEVAQKIKDPSFFTGKIASGDAFICREDQLKVITSNFKEIECVEMEAAAIAQTAYLFEVPFLVIRSLSDIAGKESTTSFDQFLEKASINSAMTVIEIVKRMDKALLTKDEKSKEKGAL